MKFWLMALVAIPALAFAYSPTNRSQCSDLDLRDSTLPEVRNQKDVSWCYAFTAADVLGHAFNEPTAISAADIAIAYNETKLGSFARWLSVNLIDRNDPDIRKVAHQTGFNKAALIKAMKEGWCPESVLPSETWTKVTPTPQGPKFDSVPLATAMLDIHALHQKRHQLTTENLPYYYEFKNVGPAEFISLLKTKKISGFYSALRDAVCRDDRRPFSAQWKVKMVFKNPKIFSSVAEQLEKGRLVSLDYDSRVLHNTSNRGLKASELHTSSIVGRRWNSERHACEYLIRNSYGPNCSNRYDPTIECRDGHIWLSESQIFHNMISIVYMLSAP